MGPRWTVTYCDLILYICWLNFTSVVQKAYKSLRSVSSRRKWPMLLEYWIVSVFCEELPLTTSFKRNISKGFTSCNWFSSAKLYWIKGLIWMENKAISLVYGGFVEALFSKMRNYLGRIRSPKDCHMPSCLSLIRVFIVSCKSLFIATLCFQFQLDQLR